ncbi:MFS general substrate transporter [Raphidocelis subcapitata]|uniref:MFS general substrate transporter n=1 Tax=Raphidocelis subcapitata TaxID=307507 RepID=A0A2V0NMF9_9CHLO|nr:MFS general substrate transporter [Raphidocelis subcapitata]|eukprot:GBF88674.1 MFS general substrate transporter [Raphidocelis subcapitata]
MSGGGGAPVHARVRIKGRKASVVRFFFLAVAHSIPWIVLLSQMAYYSKLFGPQVLLQLNIAYYLPSIPTLMLMGTLEPLLDEQLGPTPSILSRLTCSLLACAAVCAAWPFLPGRLVYVLWATVFLGAVSSVAFSVSYQLVAWFRSADTIALGIGAVGSGPISLLVQLALHVGPRPARWQWIALFEVAAAFVLLGLAGGLSLLGQYWGILTGSQPYEEGRPLLGEDDAAREEEEERREASAQQLLLTPAATVFTLAGVAGDYAGAAGLSWGPALAPGGLMPHTRAQLRSGSALRRANSAESDLSFVDWRKWQAAAAAAAAAGGQAERVPRRDGGGSGGAAGRRRRAFASDAGAVRGGVGSVSSGPSAAQRDGLRRAAAAAAAVAANAGTGGSGGDVEQGGSGGGGASGGLVNPALSLGAWLASGAASREGSASGLPPAQLLQQAGASVPVPVPAPSAAAAAAAAEITAPGAPPREPVLGTQSAPLCELSQTPSDAGSGGGGIGGGGGGGGGGFLSSASQSDSGSLSPPRRRQPAAAAAAPSQQQQQQQGEGQPNGQQEQQQQRRPDGADGAPSQPHHRRAVGASPFGSGAGPGSPESRASGATTAGGDEGNVAAITFEVLRDTWQVVLAALLSSTLLNCVFPFFTYLPSSGLLGETLPQWLFYGRIMADIVGRLLPRRRALMVTSPPALLAAATGIVVVAAAFFAYLQAPSSLLSDPLAIALVVLLWAIGGYVNTISYILAPGLVPPKRATKASALMALTYQVAHIVGLVCATAIALFLFGDISGDL